MTVVTSLVVLGALLFSSVASAATYLYVNTSGNVQSIEANNPTQAMAVAPNLAVHSGVMLVGGTPLAVGGIGGADVSVTSNTYLYVDTNGNVRTVFANNSTQAMAIAPNKALHSGVMLVK